MCLVSLESSQATITKYCRLGQLALIFSCHFWRLGGPRSRCWQTWVFVRAFLLACTWHAFIAVSLRGAERRLSWFLPLLTRTF